MRRWHNTISWVAIWVAMTAFVIFVAIIVASATGCTMHFHVMGKYYSKEKKPEYIVTMPAEENSDDEIVE